MLFITQDFEDSRAVAYGVTLAANTLARRTLDGRAYAVAPCVAIVAGVLNGQMVTAEAIAASVEGWNGRAVTLRHPARAGLPVTANSPEVFEAQAVGVIFGAVLDGERLKVELWLDVEKCGRLGGDALAVLAALDAGQAVEVSTGYFCSVTPGEGLFNGRAFRAVQSDIMPDHVALLPDEKGACSWRDGCGAPRVNCEQCAVRAARAAEEEQGMPEETEVLAGQAEPPTAESPVAPTVQEDAGDGAPAEAAPAPENQWAELGALVSEFGGVDAFRLALGRAFDVAAMVQEMGGIESVKGLLGALKANAAAQRDETLARLTANGACAFDAAELAAMSDGQLAKLERSLRPGDYSGRARGLRGQDGPEYRVLAAPSTVPVA